MTEPTYSYVKGKGWIVFSERRIQTKTWDGTEIWIVDRKPREGERYSAKRMHYGYDNDGNVNLEAFRDYVSDLHINDFAIRCSEIYKDDFVYVTIELVNP